MEKELALRITNWLNSFCQRDEIGNVKIQYSLELIFNTTLKIIGVFIFAALFHIVKDTCNMIFLFTLLRIFAGGVHCEANSTCFLVYSSIILGGAYLSSFLYIPLYLYVLSALVILYIIYRFTPSETRYHKIAKNERFKYKLISSFMVTCYVFISLLSRNVKLRTQTLVVMISIAITVLPIINRKYHSDSIH